MRKFLLSLSALVLVGVVLAQAGDLPDPSFDPREWFGSAAAFAAVIAAVVAFAKENVLDGLGGARTVAVSFGLGIAGSVVASFTPVYDAGLVEAASFGASASVLASGGWDAVKRLLRGALSGE